MRDSQDAIIVIFLVIFAALLVFPGLGATRFWQDEAQTGMLAKNILHFGVPRAWDGKNLVSYFSDHRDIRGGVYIWQPWFPFYLAAASMGIFGTSAFGARFLFAVAFVLLIGISYRLFRRWHPDRLRAILGVVLMIGCVPLLLHARQSRYYILIPLFNLLAVDSYLRLLDRPRPCLIIGLTIWSSLLFHSFFPGAVILALALGVDLLRRRPGPDIIKWLTIAGAIILIINVPWAVYYKIWYRQFGVQSGYSNPAVFGMYLFRYLLTINNFFFPLILVLLGCLWRWKAIICGSLFKADIPFLFVTICLIQLLVLSLLSDYPFTRYLIGITPFLMYLASWCVLSITSGRAWLSLTLVLLILGTNIVSILPLPLLRVTKIQKAQWTTAGVNRRFLEIGNVGLSYARGEVKQLINAPFGSPIITYIGSIVNPPKGPVDWIVEYLNREASPSDRVKIAYGDLPLMFHTDLAVTSDSEVGPPAPEWLIFRHFNSMTLNEEFVKETRKFRYSTIELPVPDIQWNNRPDPLYHYYKTPPMGLAPRLKIQKRE